MDGDRIEPDINSDGVGFCSEDCPRYDGKRCEILGVRAPVGNVCEPWAGSLVRRLRERYSALEGLLARAVRPDIHAAVVARAERAETSLAESEKVRGGYVEEIAGLQMAGDLHRKEGDAARDALSTLLDRLEAETATVHLPRTPMELDAMTSDQLRLARVAEIVRAALERLEVGDGE